jgi:hypothetical protein
MPSNWHDANRFSGLLRRAMRIAAQHNKAQDDLREAFKERYDKEWNEIDGPLQYVLESGDGKLTVREVDKIMGE